MKFKYTILYVENVTSTIEFFERAFGFKRLMIHDGGDYGELDTGTTVLSFSAMSLMKELGKNPEYAKSSAPTFEIAFETDDVSSALERAVAAGAKLVQSAEHMPWGQTTAYISDVNGFLIEICSPVSQ